MLPSILKWNIRGLRSNSEELKILFNEENPSVSCLQEKMLPTTFYNIEDITSNIDCPFIAYNTFEQHIVKSASKLEFKKTKKIKIELKQ